MSSNFSETAFAQELIRLLKVRFEQEVVYACAGHEKGSDFLEMLKASTAWFSGYINEKWGTNYSAEVFSTERVIMLRVGEGLTNDNLHDLCALQQYFEETPTPFIGHA